jgi:hypothetical protein
VACCCRHALLHGMLALLPVDVGGWGWGTGRGAATKAVWLPQPKVATP